MTPREVVEAWVERFNTRDPEGVAALYHEDAVDDQAADGPVHGRAAIANRFREDFASQNMTCIIDGIKVVGDTVVLEWADPIGLRGCISFPSKTARSSSCAAIGTNSPPYGCMASHLSNIVNGKSSDLLFNRLKMT